MENTTLTIGRFEKAELRKYFQNSERELRSNLFIATKTCKVILNITDEKVSQNGRNCQSAKTWQSIIETVIPAT